MMSFIIEPRLNVSFIYVGFLFLYLFSTVFRAYSGILWGKTSLGSKGDLQSVVESEVIFSFKWLFDRRLSLADAETELDLDIKLSIKQQS